MITNIKPKFWLGVLPMLILGGCIIQGPWEYVPKDSSVYKGIWTTGYVIANEPVRDVCFERFRELGEVWTTAFPFYQEADIKIKGKFSDGSNSLKLIPRKDSPNCFKGDPNKRPLRGNSYFLDASIKWDSAGSLIETKFNATANIPEFFEMKDSATAPANAINPPPLIPSPDSAITTTPLPNDFFSNYPPNIQDTLRKLYGDTLRALLSDSTALQQFLIDEAPKINQLVADLTAKEYKKYGEGDSVYYLTGPTNTLSHFYSSDFSMDVATVLITQKYDSNYSTLPTSFDNFIPGERTAADFFNPGFQRRLHVFTNLEKNEGSFLLDSIGIVNSWFVTGRNGLYFYGMEKAYDDYIATTVSGEQDSRIEPDYNINGAAGIFAGGIKDSFIVYIKPPPGARTVSRDSALIAVCRKKGFSSRMECRKIYDSYCREINYDYVGCALSAVSRALEIKAPADTFLTNIDDNSINLPMLVSEARKRMCVRKNFPDSLVFCKSSRTACINETRSGSCKSFWFTHCMDNNWKPQSCAPATVLFCNTFDGPKEICREAKNYCQSQQEDSLCGK